jgi:hypothetical protein
VKKPFRRYRNRSEGGSVQRAQIGKVGPVGKIRLRTRPELKKKKRIKIKGGKRV